MRNSCWICSSRFKGMDTGHPLHGSGVWLPSSLSLQLLLPQLLWMYQMWCLTSRLQWAGWLAASTHYVFFITGWTDIWVLKTILACCSGWNQFQLYQDQHLCVFTVDATWALVLMEQKKEKQRKKKDNKKKKKKKKKSTSWYPPLSSQAPLHPPSLSLSSLSPSLSIPHLVYTSTFYLRSVISYSVSWVNHGLLPKRCDNYISFIL